MKYDVTYINGDGVGPEVVSATKALLQEAVKKAYNGNKTINFYELLIGNALIQKGKNPIPESVLKTIKNVKFCLKGPMATPSGTGHRSYNVSLRQKLDLFANVRPIIHLPNVNAPIKHPEKVNMIIIRENLEDLYMGYEYAFDTNKAKQLAAQLNLSSDKQYGIGIKPISIENTKRLTDFAIKTAVDLHKSKITVTHKGNILKYTEGLFLNTAKNTYNSSPYKDKLTLDDCITDALFQGVIMHPQEYEIILAPNLTGDYLSDACAALVGGIGIAPGANIGTDAHIYEAVHGTASALQGQDLVNPTALMLSGVNMLKAMGLHEASELMFNAIIKTYKNHIYTKDIDSKNYVSTTKFTNTVINYL